MPQYPRDLVGYGSNPPHPQWAKGARLALQFVIMKKVEKTAYCTAV